MKLGAETVIILGVQLLLGGKWLENWTVIIISTKVEILVEAKVGVELTIHIVSYQEYTTLLKCTPV